MAYFFAKNAAQSPFLNIPAKIFPNLCRMLDIFFIFWKNDDCSEIQRHNLFVQCFAGPVATFRAAYKLALHDEVVLAF